MILSNQNLIFNQLINRLNIKGNVNNSSIALTSNSRNEDYPKIIYINGKPFIDARKLHNFLGVKKKFADWFIAKCKSWGFIEDIDYLSIDNLTSPFGEVRLSSGWGGHLRKDFFVSIDMAKEIGMVERTKIGKELRRYYILIEERLKGKHPFLSKCNQQIVNDKVYYFFKDVMRTLGYNNLSVAWRLMRYPAHFLKHPSGYFITEEYASLLAYSKGLIAKREQLKSSQLIIPFAN